MRVEVFDNSKLNAKIAELGMTHRQVAAEMDMLSSTFSMKINGKSQFYQSEIYRLIIILKIPRKQIDEYFFTTKVQCVEQ